MNIQSPLTLTRNMHSSRPSWNALADQSIPRIFPSQKRHATNPTTPSLLSLTSPA